MNLAAFTFIRSGGRGGPCEESQISCQGARCCSNNLLFSSPTNTKKKHGAVTSGVHGVSALALTLGIGFMCEHAGVFFFFARMPTQRDSSKVESCLRGQWEYPHVAISIKT